ncbi:MAG: DUF4974 domain-containing protein [Bacteroidetes bacterium]|nr:MAG: DUF4974 domain-containing protein [Bacteroidota bacterium]
MTKTEFYDCWAKKLSGEASQAELDAYYQYLTAHPEMERVVGSVGQIWQQKQAFPNTDGLWQQLHANLQKRNDWETTLPPLPAHAVEQHKTIPLRQKKVWIWLSVAACAAAVLMLASGSLQHMLWPPTGQQQQTPPDWQNQVRTQTGNRTSLTLPDGSKAWLNANSSIRYGNGYGSANRNIWLAGEALFEVAKNKALPFIIHTNSMQVRATGTMFSVRAYEKEAQFETALLEGEVIVTLNDKSHAEYTLKPHQKLLVSNISRVLPQQAVAAMPVTPTSVPQVVLERINYQPVDSTAVEIAWVYNKLAFSDESFAGVAAKMEHWYGVDFEFENAALAQERLSGSFEKETLVQALKALQYTTPFRFKITGNRVFIYP